MWDGGEYFCMISLLEIKTFYAHMLHAVYCGADAIEFLKDIKDGTIVMMASFDDPATKYFFCISSLASATLLPVACHVSCIAAHVASCSYCSPSVPQSQR